MKITISFAELRDYVKTHYDNQLGFAQVSDTEVCVTYTQNLFFRTVQVPINLKIDYVRSEAVAITYNGGFGIDMIIGGTLTFLKMKVPELADALTFEEGHRVRIDLSKLPQTTSLVEAVALQNIKVTENGIVVEALLK